MFDVVLIALLAVVMVLGAPSQRSAENKKRDVSLFRTPGIWKAFTGLS
jgi:hypothetical protein